MNRRLLVSVMIIGLVGAGVGGTTLAMFNDTEVSEDNMFTAGELDLLVDWMEYYNGEHIETQELTNDPGAIFHLEDVKPGDHGEAIISLHLEDNPGWIWMNMIQTANENLNCPEPQQEALGVDSAEECPEEGHLGEYLEFTIYSTDESGELYSEDDIIFQGTADELEEQSMSEGVLLDGDSSTSQAEAFPGGETSYVGVKWNVPLETGNIIQGDSKKFDIGFYTEQRRHNDDPQNPWTDPDNDTEDNETEVNYTQTNWQVDLIDGEVIEDLAEQSYSDRGDLEYARHGFTNGTGPQLPSGDQLDEARTNQVEYIVDDSAEVEVTGGPEDPVGVVNFEVKEDISDLEEATFVSYENVGEIGWSGGHNQVLFDYEIVEIDADSESEQQVEVDLPQAQVEQEETEDENGAEEEPVASGDLTFNDQMISEEGEVVINNVSTNVDTTVLVTYEDGDDTIKVGHHNAPADLDNFDPMTLELNDSGVPGEHTARMIEKPIEHGYSDGDALNEDTLEKQYFSQSAQISAQDEEQPVSSAHGNLTFNYQMVDGDGQVTINNVSTTVDSTVYVTYDNGSEPVIAGIHNAPAGLDNFDPMIVGIDESGVPGEHTARMIEKPITYGYSSGDVLQNDTLEKQYFSQSAYITGADDGEEVSDEGNQFYTDFSDYTEGVSLFDEDWTSQLGADEHVNFTVMQLDGEYVAELVRPEDSDRNAASWDVVSDTEGEIEAFAEWKNTDEASGDMRPSILLHGSGDSAEEAEGVRFENRPNGDEFNIAEYVDGEWSGELAAESFEYSEDEYYKLRAWTNGTHSEMTVWERGQDEEDGVTVATDETTIESGEFNGVFEWQDGATQYPFTEIGFGTEGETAPSSE